MKIFNVSLRKVGGISFLKLGRINISWCVSRTFKEVMPRTTVLDMTSLKVIDVSVADFAARYPRTMAYLREH